MSYWDKIKNGVWVLCTVTILAALMVIFVPEYQRYRRNMDTLLTLQDDYKAKELELQRLKDHQKRFKTDAAFVEKIAHEQGMVKPGQVLFKFADPEGNTLPADRP